MWKPFGSIFGCCLAALPLIGCAGGYSPLPPQAGTPRAAVVATMPDQGVYVTRLRRSLSSCLGQAETFFCPAILRFGPRKGSTL